MILKTFFDPMAIKGDKISENFLEISKTTSAATEIK